MPFTFSHAAAVWPLSRLPLPLSALIVGSMAPDFIYFVRLEPHGEFSHTLPGLFGFSLPAGLVMLWVFHRVIKRPAVSLMPEALQRRLWPAVELFRFLPPGRLLLVAAALVLGAATHLLWDSFTHRTGWGVMQFPALRTDVLVPYVGPVPGYRIVQHASTVLGGGVLILWAWLWDRRAPAGERVERIPLSVRLRALVVLAGVPLAVGVAYALLWAPRGERTLVVYIVIAAVSTLFAMLLVYGAAAEWRRRRPWPAG